MWRETFQKWDGRGAFLLRLDYGYSVAEVTGGGLETSALDLERLPLAHIEEALHGVTGHGGIRTFVGADRLVSLGRRRGGGDLWQAVGHAAGIGGLLLVARFPRLAESLARALSERGLWAGAAENEVSGDLPPLYQSLPAGSPLMKVHLAYEWETGVARARATTVLTEAGALMAQRGVITPGQLGQGLGSTAGAARSYLNWMVDAGLARRAAAGFALRHPALAALFGEPAPPRERAPLHNEASPPAPPADQEELAPARPPTRGEAILPSVRRWDPSELD